MLFRSAYQSPIEMECVGLHEALAEKLVSFPRRLALQLQKPNGENNLDTSTGWDKALVRHLYDVHQIIKHGPSGFELEPANLASLVSSVIVNDAIEFENQHPQFYTKPVTELNDALNWAKDSLALINQYVAFVSDMVYAEPENTPSFGESLDVFTRTLQGTLGLIKEITIPIAVNKN